MYSMHMNMQCHDRQTDRQTGQTQKVLETPAKHRAGFLAETFGVGFIWGAAGSEPGGSNASSPVA